MGIVSVVVKAGLALAGLAFLIAYSLILKTPDNME